jgi:hypothetical protein
VAFLVCAPLLTVLVFGACVVTTLFYLKLDPVKWLTVGVSAATVTGTAVTCAWARRRRLRHGLSENGGPAEGDDPAI